jgi:hypothetical protein
VRHLVRNLVNWYLVTGTWYLAGVRFQ